MTQEDEPTTPSEEPQGRKVAEFYVGLSVKHLDELGKALEAAIGEPLAFKGPGLQVWTMK